MYGLRSVTILNDGTVVNMGDESGFAQQMQNVAPVISVEQIKGAIELNAQEDIGGAGIQLAQYAAVKQVIEDDDDEQRPSIFEGASNVNDLTHAKNSGMKGEWATSRVIQILNKQFMPQGVEIMDVTITNVELPDEIVSKMTSKTMVISENAQEIMTQQYDMQELKFSEDLKKMSQTFSEEREQEKQDGAFARNEATVRLNSMHAETDKAVSVLVQENQVLMQQINADADLSVTKLQQDRNRITTELATQSSAQAATIQARADQYCVQKQSEVKRQFECIIWCCALRHAFCDV